MIAVSCPQLHKESPPNEDYFQKAYPNYMFTKSFGVLKDSDFEGYEKNQKKQPVGIGAFRLDSPSWVCAESKQFEFILHDMGPSDDPTETENKHNCDFLLKVNTENFVYEFLPRRAYPIEFCREIISDWKNLASQDGYLCAAGEALFEDKKTDEEKILRRLVYRRIKSKTKCLSLFLNDCTSKAE